MTDFSTPITCDTLELALASDDREEQAAARTHAVTCERCAETVRVWDEISAAAQSMRREWQSPELWNRIRQEGLEGRDGLEGQEGLPGRAGLARRAGLASRFIPLAAAASLVIATAGGWWFYAHRDGSSTVSGQQLLSTRALRDIERIEADYAGAIERLSAVAQPAVDADATPLGLAQKEKLLLIDTAIAQLRDAIDANQYNTHLRQELLAMYREKRLTLEEILNEPKPGT